MDQLVEYQCTVSGSGFLSLTWKILQDNGTQFGSPVVYASNVLAGSSTIGGLFTVEQLSQSPLVSNISFTVQSSINGYTIICEDGVTLKNENVTTDISGHFVVSIIVKCLCYGWQISFAQLKGLSAFNPQFVFLMLQLGNKK